MAPRADKRTGTELRPLALTQSLLSRADGSAKFSFGDVTALASVTGPTEVRIVKELVDRATLEINVKPLRGQAGPSEKATETLLLSLVSPIILLHLHARSLIQLSIQTLSSPTVAFSQPFSTDPSSLAPSSSSDLAASSHSTGVKGLSIGTSEKAAQINSAMLALIDGAIECKATILAVAIAFLPIRGSDETEMVLDPTPFEEEISRSCHLFVFSFGVGGNGGAEGVCVGIDSLGRCSEDELFDAQDLAGNATRGIMVFVRKSIEARYGISSKPNKKEEDEEDAMQE